ncbi:MAG TPA: exosortase/archaeosortase family protein [Luteibaculaceae bacterium]|nr:exosortase/archaeosortase family protein [Luteibaculaceae bacterium]
MEWMRACKQLWQNAGAGGRFLIRLGLFLLIWELIYRLLVVPYTGVDQFFIEREVQHAGWLLEKLGFPVDLSSATPGIIDRIYIIDGYGSVVVKRNCNALELMAIIPLLMWAYPASRRHRSWMVAGMLIVFLLNMVRIAALAWLQAYHPQWLDFNHTYTFNVLVAVLIMLGWLWWIKKVDAA